MEATSTPDIVARSAHPISRASISNAALKTLYRLKEAGYQAFLVGGGVRDLLLGIEPKDFDIATDAHPEDLRRVFRNCRLIGRRFRLAHVHWGGEIIEVATFRASEAPPEVDDEDPREAEHYRPGAEVRLTDEAGRLLRDNVYGSIDEDVWRRDFTCNALYYNIADFSVWDYVGGVQDVRDRVLRLIGDPEQRYREDPVRLLRAIRFAAKLGFSFHPDTEKPMRALAPLLASVPPARLFDESLKLFLAGHAMTTFTLLEQHGLLEPLFPALHEALARDGDGRYRALIEAGLRGTDERVAADKPVTPTFLFATLLYPAIEAEARRRAASGKATVAQLLAESGDAVVSGQVRRISVPKRFTLPLHELLMLQPRFERRDGKRMLALLNHPRFRAAYDLFVLRARAGLADAELATFWTEVQVLPADDRLALVGGLSPAAPGAGGHEPDDGGEGGAGDAPRRRRRRGGRRRSGGGAPGGEG